MQDFLNRLLGRTTGFVYVPHSENGAMKDARPGARVGRRGPPWIVVQDAPENVIITAWPGKLWRVRILQRASKQPASYAGYRRADFVTVIEEVPCGLMFGGHGEAVAKVIDAAAALTLATAQRLAEAQPDDAGAAYSRSWKRWLSKRDATDEGLPRVVTACYHADHAEDHARTLAIGRHQSPIFGGLMTVYNTVSKRAKMVAGDVAWRAEGDEVVLNPPWDGASEALLHAALAFGAPEICEGDQTTLLTAWSTVFPS
jgi:hypothetical protein